MNDYGWSNKKWLAHFLSSILTPVVVYGFYLWSPEFWEPNFSNSLHFWIMIAVTLIGMLAPFYGLSLLIGGIAPFSLHRLFERLSISTYFSDLLGGVSDLLKGVLVVFYVVLVLALAIGVFYLAYRILLVFFKVLEWGAT